jgi:hypothetical protein
MSSHDVVLPCFSAAVLLWKTAAQQHGITAAH